MTRWSPDDICLWQNNGDYQPTGQAALQSGKRAVGVQGRPLLPWNVVVEPKARKKLTQNDS